jgi:hypothetical protein
MTAMSARADKRGFVRYCFAAPRVPHQRNAVEQFAGFFGCQHGSLAFPYDIFSRLSIKAAQHKDSAGFALFG